LKVSIPPLIEFIILLTNLIDAEKFKNSDEAFSKKFEARQQLESYISRVEEIVSDPTMSLKLKRGTKEKIESALSDAMQQLEIEASTADDLKKKELALKRTVSNQIGWLSREDVLRYMIHDYLDWVFRWVQKSHCMFLIRLG
jgi:hypothetical protein